ncbi:ribonuclease P protein component [Candidatus Kaiserbacteria bacterium]|nr:ribonuclease P protein component [Candidatus Kaiserbacteria bacterium]
MLPKHKRLTAAEVREILKSGRSARSSTLSAKYVPSPSARAAVVVSKKVAKTAVLRNKLRRAAYDALGPLLPAQKNIVLFLHKPALDIHELTSLCSKLS